MTLSRVPKILFLLAVATAVYMLLSAVVWIGTAHAQVEAPPVVVTPAPGASVTDIMTVILLGAIAVLSSLRTFLQFLAPRTQTTVDDRLLAKIEEILAVIPRPPREPAPLPIQRDGQRGSATLAALGLMGAGVLAGAMLSASLSCAGSGPLIRAKATVATDAFLDCEEPQLAALVADIVPFAVATIKSWVSGDGAPDRAGIKHNAAKVATMAGQCAWEAAIAVLMQPAVTELAGSPQAAPERLDRAALAAVWIETRRELGWAPVR